MAKTKSTRAYLRAKYPGAFPLSENQIEVLEALSREGPTNAYKVAKSAGKAYSFVFNFFRELERRKMIAFKGQVKTEKGTKAKNYDLLLEAVLFVLHKKMLRADEDRGDYDLIHAIIKKYESLVPLVFGKWSHFKKMGVEKIAYFRLKVLVDTFKADPLGFKQGTTFIFGKLACEMEENVCWYFYFQFQHFKYDLAWMDALRQDKEIKNYVIKELQLFRENMSKLDGIINGTLEEL